VLGEVRVAVVPGDEVGGRVGAGEVLARDPEPVVLRRPDRIDDRVVVPEQLLARDVGAELDAAEVAEGRVGRRLLVDPGDGLDLRVVRGDAGADEPERRRQAVEQVDLEARLEQRLGGVEAGGPGAQDDDACRDA
jgi:hypothetical protein